MQSIINSFFFKLLYLKHGETTFDYIRVRGWETKTRNYIAVYLFTPL